VLDPSVPSMRADTLQFTEAGAHEDLSDSAASLLILDESRGEVKVDC
jgi:hypothetical protein